MKLLYFVLYGSVGAWMPFLTVYLARIGLSSAEIGTLLSVRPAMMILTQPVWGMLADNWGRRRTMLWLLSMTGLLVIAILLGQSFWFLLGWSVLYAVAFGPLGALTDSICLDVLDGDGDNSFGGLRLWGSIGWAVTSLLTGFLIEGRDMRLMFGFGALIVFVGWFLTWRSNPGTKQPGNLGGGWDGVQDLLANHELVAFLLLVFLLRVGNSAIYVFFPLYMDDLGASDQQLGLASAVNSIVEVPMFLVSAAFISRIGTKRTLILTLLLLSARAFLYSLFSRPNIGVLLQVMQAGFSLFIVASVNHVNGIVPQRWRSTGQTLFWAAYFSAGSVVGSATAGLLYDSIGPRALFRIASIFILAVAIPMLLLLHDRPADCVARPG